MLTTVEKWRLQGGEEKALSEVRNLGATQSKLREMTAMGVPSLMAEGLTEHWGSHVLTSSERDFGGRAGGVDEARATRE